jgi:hypothetical protein
MPALSPAAAARLLDGLRMPHFTCPDEFSSRCHVPSSMISPARELKAAMATIAAAPGGQCCGEHLYFNHLA